MRSANGPTSKNFWWSNEAAETAHALQPVVIPQLTQDIQQAFKENA